MIKIDAFDLKKAYDDFFDAQQNQITRFEQVRTAVNKFAGLASFTGEQAENTKAYISEVHIDVLDTLLMGLAELEVKLLNLNLDFKGVDTNGNAVLSDDYLNGISTAVGTHITNVTYGTPYEKAVNTLIGSVTDLISLPKPDFQTFYNQLDDVKTSVDGTCERLTAFDEFHADDMSNILSILDSVSAACSYINGTSSPTSYNPQTIKDLDWYVNLEDCRLKSYAYVSTTDPNFEKTVYYQIAFDAGLTTLVLVAGTDPQQLVDVLQNMELWGGYIKDGHELPGDVKGVIAAIELYRKGIRFTQETNAAGQTVLRAVSTTGKRIRDVELARYMKNSFDTDLLSKKYLEQIANGLISEDGIKMTKNGFDLFGRPSAQSLKSIEDVADSIHDISAYNGATGGARFVGEFKSGIKGISGLDWAMYGVDICFDLYDGFYDERTRAMGEFDASEFAAGALVDTATFLAPIGAAAAAGAAWGSAVPGIGTIVGAGVGLIIGVCSLPIYGEPPEGLFDKAKRGVDDFLEGAGNFFSKLFW